MQTILQRLILDPYSLGTVLKHLIQRFKIGSYETRLRLGAVDRAHYGYIVYNAAVLAKRLGHDRISVLEFGVGGGNGLLNLEYHAEEISKLLSIEIDIYGFDTGEGLPQLLDYRDLPYHWKPGFDKMDVPKLQAKLKRAKLVLGDIRETSKEFFEKQNPAPIGAIAYDLDFYSSTAAALSMLEADERHYLPRVFCYFDDTTGTDIALFSDFTGQRLSIHEFNEAHKNIKLGLPYHLLTRRTAESWYHQLWICHFFEHSCYNEFVGVEAQEVPCG